MYRLIRCPLDGWWGRSCETHDKISFRIAVIGHLSYDYQVLALTFVVCEPRDIM